MVDHDAASIRRAISELHRVDAARRAVTRGSPGYDAAVVEVEQASRRIIEMIDPWRPRSS